jgi:enoyl-CoA hydratase
MPDREFIDYEVEDRIAIITLNRPQARNAQNTQLLTELDAAWTDAARDDEVRVIVLKANGPHFSAGHDLTSDSSDWFGPSPGLAHAYDYEARHYLGLSRRWRDIPKPSIAAVHGATIAAGLMLIWPCDLIVAADTATFSDPVVLMGIGGVEYHGHTWELGARKAKELLFTAGKISAEDARERGMVNRVVPADRLVEETLDLAREIARMDPFGLAQAKRAVNQTLDVMGQYAAMQAVFDIHWTGHGHAMAATGSPSLMGLADMKKDRSS